ncbi:hypothetical protein D3C76_1855840 [compost metagenome]
MFSIGRIAREASRSASPEGREGSITCSCRGAAGSSSTENTSTGVMMFFSRLVPSERSRRLLSLRMIL